MEWKSLLWCVSVFSHIGKTASKICLRFKFIGVVFWVWNYHGCAEFNTFSLSPHSVFTTVSSQPWCSQGQYMYSPTSCLELSDQNLPLSNEAAQTNCTTRGLTGLATFEEFDQFEALRSFLEVLLQDNDTVWLGYYYDTNNNVLVRGSDEMSESVVFSDMDNFAAGGASPGDGACIAIGQDGLLRRRMCNEPLPYACYQNHGKLNYPPPSPTLSLSLLPSLSSLPPLSRTTCTQREPLGY